MRRALTLACLLLCVPSAASADAVSLERLDAVHEACETARDRRHARLYVIEVDPGWELGRHRAERLHVSTRRNLPALDGRVSLLIGGLEPVGFEADEETASALREAARAGARLRLGFFLGFDDPGRQPCLVRGAHGVTIVRADLAFAELLTSREERLARSETDRLRAWLDDREALAVPGEGPRGAIGEARFENGASAPESWQRALSAARPAIGRCHAEGVARGAAPEGQVVVRLNIEARSGEVRRADVALSSLGDAPEAECIARALGSGVTLGAGPGGWQAQYVDLAVPVRLVAD
ncbi:MAG: hypothetical protein VYE22_34715 [Myxococcota bacterium]|nr:hypothetical protein [Myxococcota bacterium]